MRMRTPVLALGVLLMTAVGAAAQQQGMDTAPPPPWAYGFTSPADSTASDPPAPPPFAPVEDDGTLRRLPGSARSFTITQIRDSYWSLIHI